MRLVVEVGSAPCGEQCAQVGCDDYALLARAECRRFIMAIRATVGAEPPGAKLVVRANLHDFGTYYEVAVVVEDDSNNEAVTYAYLVQEEAPTKWSAEVSA